MRSPISMMCRRESGVTTISLEDDGAARTRPVPAARSARCEHRNAESYSKYADRPHDGIARPRNNRPQAGLSA